jgi:TP901 family phage tail tape measure protein
MATTEELIIKVSADIAGIKTDMDNVKGSISGVGDEADKAEGRMGKATGFIRQHWLGVTTVAAGAAAAIGGSLLSIAGEFDDATDNIRIGTGATGEALESLTNDMKVVAANVPASVGSVGDVSTAIADLNTRLGLTGEPLQAMAQQMVELSSIAGTDLAGTIEVTTRVFGDWGISTEEQSEKLDYLFKVSQSTGVGIDDLSAKMVQYGAPLRQMGFDYDTAAALIGKFNKEGVNTELVMGSLRIALSKMADEGITDANQALEEIIERIKSAGSASEANGIAIEMFGARAGPDMAAAIREGRFEVSELVSTVQGSSETIGQAAADTYDYSERMSMMFTKLKIAALPIGEIIFDAINAAMPALESIIGYVADLTTRFVNFARNGGFDEIKAFIRDGIERMREMLGPTIAAVKEFAGSEGLGRVSEAAGVLIGWLKGLYTLLDDLGVFRRMGETLGTMVESFLWVIGTISDVIMWVNDLYTTFRTTYDSIDSGTSSFRETINNGWNAIRTAISNIVAGILQDIIEGWNKFLNAIGLGNNKILGSITTIGESILGQWTSDMNKMPTVAGGAMQSAATTIRSYGDEIARAANSTAQRGIDALAAGFKEMQRIKAQASNVTISAPSSSSGSSSSNRKYDAAISQQQSSSRSSATAKNAPYDAPSQSVKPRKYASGGMIPHTGFHLLHEKEVVIPPKPNWNNLLVRPILNAFSQSGAPAGGVSRMEITIHNYGDLRALEKTLLRSKQAGTSNNMRVI